MFALGLYEGEIHEEIPYRAVDAVDERKSDEECQRRPRAVDAVEGERDGRHDGHGVFTAVDQVREDVARVLVATDALKEAPYRG